MSRRECKKLLAAFAAATFCYVGAAQAETLNLTPSSTETFESYSPAGTTIVATSVGGVDLVSVTPAATGNTSNLAASVTSPSGLGVQTDTFFPTNALPAFTAGTPVYISAWVIRPTSADYIMTVGVLNAATTANSSPTFGFVNSSGVRFAVRQAHFGSSFYSTTGVTLDHWYELVLAITPNADPTAVTGTLYARDVTAGETEYTALPGLTDINMGFDAINNPWLPSGSQYDKIYTSQGKKTQIDNITIGTWNVPEPGSMALLLAGGALLGAWRHR